MLTTHPDLARPLACRLARDLAHVGDLGVAAVVLLDRSTGDCTGRCTIGADVGVSLDGVGHLVLSSDPAIVEVGRAHDLRDAAARWGVTRLLIVPCLFGHDLLAVAVVPLGAGIQPDRQLAARLADRFAAAVTRTGLLAACVPATAGSAAA